MKLDKYHRDNDKRVGSGLGENYARKKEERKRRSQFQSGVGTRNSKKRKSKIGTAGSKWKNTCRFDVEDAPPIPEVEVSHRTN